MRVVLTDFARSQVRQTARYIMHEFGRKSRDKFLQEMHSIGKLLGDNPHMGAIEPLLVDLPSEYRSIVISKLNKVIYRILDDHIEVSDVWDVRRNPQTLVNQIK